ncbi:MFS transporter [Actinomadura sp. K4S16]|uniref:MFS transporter n=1 Tax=Actinomadura sp. K4S16 TaxID=1316147 RepID=UPI0011F05194|nr:MFS transporter [Actinomadura sp. K4S16]
MTPNDGTGRTNVRAPELGPPTGNGLLAVLMLGTFIVVFDTAAVVIPLPAILDDLGGTLDMATWAYGAFVLVFAVFLLPAARLADRYGRRPMFLSGMALFTLSSLACALAPSIGFLTTARGVEGLGAAMAEPAIFAMVNTAFSGKAKERAVGAHRGAFALAALSAPLLSGLITWGLSWEFVFYLNVLVGTAVTVAGIRLVPDTGDDDTPRSLDAPGVLLGGFSVFALAFAVIEGTRLGWSSPPIVASLVAGVVLLGLFVLHEKRADAPLVDRGLPASRRFTAGNLARGLGEFASLGLFFALSHLLQVQLDHSALAAGAILMTIIVGAVIAAPVSESLTGKTDVRLLVIPGFLLIAAGTFWVTLSSPHPGWLFFLAPLAIAGAGFGLQEDPTAATALQDIPPERSIIGRNISYVAYLLGITAGVAVVSGVWQSRFVANAQDALGAPGLPPAAHELSADLSSGGVSGDPAASITGPDADRLREIVHTAFTDAVGTALLSCVAVAVLGALVAVLLAPSKDERSGSSTPDGMTSG